MNRMYREKQKISCKRFAKSMAYDVYNFVEKESCIISKIKTFTFNVFKLKLTVNLLSVCLATFYKAINRLTWHLKSRRFEFIQNFARNLNRPKEICFMSFIYLIQIIP